MSTVTCFVEVDAGEVVDASLRALTLARRLDGGEGLRALVTDEPGPAVAAQLAAFGVADLRYLSHPEVHGYAPLVLAAALEELGAPVEETAVVAAATDHGHEILAHLGARAGLELVANCIDVARDGTRGGVTVVRHRWGGSLFEEAVLASPGGLFSVAADGVSAEPAPAPAAISVAPLTPDVGSGELAVQAADSPAAGSGVSLASARVVVSGGRGIGGPEGFAVVEELAGLLGGAVGVSRVVTSAGWRPHREQVGQTGTKVTPHLYLACGISGAIQHLAGCQGAKHMVAINTDPQAPIMARADYAVIGDAMAVLPALVEALKARRSRRAVTRPGRGPTAARLRFRRPG